MLIIYKNILYVNTNDNIGITDWFIIDIYVVIVL